MKSVSILKEVITGEKRVIILPEQIDLFIKSGFKVYVESGAGAQNGFSNKEYVEHGAVIVSKNDAWRVSPFILKYKAPIESEYKYFHEKLNLCAFFHAEGNPLLVDALIKSRMTAYSYELIKTKKNIFPLSFASSEIAGKLAVLYGAYHLQSHLNGGGVLLSDTRDMKPPKVLIIGYGNVGGAAAKLAIKLGVNVTVLGTNSKRLNLFKKNLKSDNLRCLINTPKILEAEISKADLVIGAIQISTYDTKPLVTDTLVKKMKKGSMIIDVTCGYGKGYLPTFDHFTSFDEPVYEKFGVLHCKIKNLPAAVPVTTNYAVSKLVAPFLLKIGKNIFSANKKESFVNSGIIVKNGEIISPVVKKNIKLIKKSDGTY